MRHLSIINFRWLVGWPNGEKLACNFDLDKSKRNCAHVLAKRSRKKTQVFNFRLLASQFGQIFRNDILPERIIGVLNGKQQGEFRCWYLLSSLVVNEIVPIFPSPALVYAKILKSYFENLPSDLSWTEKKSWGFVSLFFVSVLFPSW